MTATTTIPCETCHGTREETVGDHDPQHDRQIPCRDCHGSGAQPCSVGCCPRPATVLAWCRDGKTCAHREPLCEQCVLDHLARGEIVAVEPPPARETRLASISRWPTCEVIAERTLGFVTLATIGDYQAWEPARALELAAAIVRGAAFVAAGNPAIKEAS